MRKMDEMELRISQKGIKWSWFFMVISLFVWGSYQYIKTKETSLPLILVTLQYLVYFLVTSIEKTKLDDNSGKKKLFLSLGITLLLLVFGTILYLTIGR